MEMLHFPKQLGFSLCLSHKFVQTAELLFISGRLFGFAVASAGLYLQNIRENFVCQNSLLLTVLSEY